MYYKEGNQFYNDNKLHKSTRKKSTGINLLLQLRTKRKKILQAMNAR